MTSMAEAHNPKQAVTVSLKDLRNSSVPFEHLEDAFGPSSLGIIIVNDLPARFLELRLKLLTYASYLANLPSKELENISSPSSKYLTGWSHGKEILKAGQYDTHKGSFYVNCGTFCNAGTHFASSPPSSESNLWPPEELLPGFRSTFEELCTLIIDTAILVARTCDRYAEANIEAYEKGYLERVVKASMTTKARLLHYFPPSPQGQEGNAADEDTDSWCATHVDHGCLTGLTSALYVAEPFPLPTFPSSLPTLPSSPDPLAGLYIRSRTSETIKVNIPPSHLAFQTGEALELITQGKFKAVPHFVRGPRRGYLGEKGESVARNTLAVFTQPNLEEMVDREKGLTFGEFAKMVGERHGG